MFNDQKPDLSSNESQQVNSLASQCVKCALCLPHCPTYKITEDENESPRGRIALFQAIAQGELPLNAKSKGHLDRCLGCSACERVCPAKVQYGQLLDQGRYLLNTRDPALARQSISPLIRGFTRLLRERTWLRTLQWVLWGLQRTGLRAFARQTQLVRLLGLQRFEAILPQPVQKPSTIAQTYEPLGPKRGTVLFFLGCMTDLCDPETLSAALHVLRVCGYQVIIPPDQTCCGAVNLHAGDLPTAQACAKTNQQAFSASDSPVDAVISLATGCTVVIGDYQHNVIDLVSFLVHHAEIPTATLRPMPLDVWVHTPCTRRNILRECSDPEKLLQKIPALRLHTISNPDCCGAAGTYMLENPEMADTLADKLLNSMKQTPIDKLATTNIGCALHLQQRLNHTNPGIKTVHPVVLLAQSMTQI